VALFAQFHSNLRAMGVQRGFTLIEVMVAVVILCVGVLGWMSFQGSTIRNRAVSREMTRALMVTQARLDQVVALAGDWDDTSPDLNASGPCALQTVSLDDFDYDNQCWVAGGKPPGSDRQFWRVRVETTWGEGKSRTLALVRVVAGK